MFPDEKAARERVAGWSAKQIADVSRRIALGGQPLFDIEVASGCNLTCRFCPRDQMTRPERNMTDETFAAVERFLPATATVMFAGLGEPLANPRLSDYVARLKRRGVSSCVITNGTLLTPAKAQALIDAGISEIQVSVQSLDATEFRKLVPDVEAETVLAHARWLGANRPAELRLRLNVVATPENGHSLEALAAFAREHDYEIFIRKEHNRGGHLGVAGGVPDGCGIFAAVTFITSQGDVMSCVNDVAGDSKFGNVGELVWGDVLDWKVRKFEEARLFPACGSCDDGYRWVVLRDEGLLG